jgi:N utilization substance protein B
LAERPAVDATIDKRLQNWTLARMAVLDRSILRLGCYELLYRADTPTRVIINEWIELAKSYGSEGRTAGLVNGVLDRIAKDHRSG